MLDRAAILARIPHQGSMCLLDRVEQWDEASLSCTAGSHRSPANPLRAHGRLGSACAVEYAAQAMALHGALTANAQDGPRAGYLVSIRGTVLHASRLDDVQSDLRIAVRRFSGDGNTVLYDFTLEGDGRPLAQGRAAVVMDAAAL